MDMTKMTAALTRALKDIERRPSDAAVIALARHYSRLLDADAQDAELATAVGPKFLATLDHLMMTPKARASTLKGAGEGGNVSNPVDELRARRAKRLAARRSEARKN